MLPEMNDITCDDGMVALLGQEALIAKTEDRLKAHAALGETNVAVAREFCHDLAESCPFVQCVALTGSLASGAFRDGDDIDFDLFVDSGTKYICYLLGTLLGLKYAWRHRGREVSNHHRTPVLPKLTCVNVVWTENETRPFVRKDEGLAYELLRCHPLMGSSVFRKILRNNGWLQNHFPQIYDREWVDEVHKGEMNALGRFLASLRRVPPALRILDAASRGLAWVLYTFVQWTRRNDPEAMEHLEFLRRVKYPYEVFQD